MNTEQSEVKIIQSLHPSQGCRRRAANPFDAARDELYKKLRAALGEAQLRVALCFLNNATRMKYYGGKGLAGAIPARGGWSRKPNLIGDRSAASSSA